MHFSTTIATTVFAISLSAAILFPPECIIPPQIFHSLDQSFTLSILQPSLIIGGPFAWLPLQLTPVTPTKQTSSKLVNNKAQSKIAPSKFVLKNRKLIAHGFPAKSLPIAETLPRPLAPVVFGGTAILADNVKFFAGYSCDGNNELYLGLFADPSGGVTEALAVNQEVDGAQIFLKPLGYKGPAINLPIKIDKVV